MRQCVYTMCSLSIVRYTPSSLKLVYEYVSHRVLISREGSGRDGPVVAAADRLLGGGV